MPRGSTKSRGNNPTNGQIPQDANFADHPFRNQANHDELLDYLKIRLEAGRKQRDGRLRRYANIDKQYAAWGEYTDEDRERRIRKERTGKQIPVNMNVPLTLLHLEDMTTYFMKLFAPITGMYTMSGTSQQKELGMGLTKIMENDATHTGAFRELRRAILASLKYNVGGFLTNWSVDVGNQISGQGDNLQVDRKTFWEGNRIQCLDMYNTFWDPTVSPPMQYRDGEFCATVESTSRYRIERDADNGLYFNVADFLRTDARGNPQFQYEFTYYKSAPSYARLDGYLGDGRDQDGTDWMAFAGYTDDVFLTRNNIEKTTIYIRINPWEWYLVPQNKKQTRNKKEIWRITILNNDTIVETTFMNNTHDYLPFNFCMPMDDEMELSQRSAGEIVDPFQTFASFLFNAHVEAHRKNIYGTTFYDPSLVDYDSVPKGEAAARVPIKPAGQGRDIRTMVFHDNNVLDTNQNLQALDNAQDILRQILPTQADPAQIASIERAVKNQVSAVRQGSNSRIHLLGRLIDNQMMRTSRVLQYYNILQFRKEPINVNVDGQETSIQPERLRELELEFVLGNGLQALDLESIVENLRDLIFVVLQSQEATQQFDVPRLLNEVSKNMMLDLDLNEFRREIPNVQQGNPEQAVGGPDAVPPAIGGVGRL